MSDRHVDSPLTQALAALAASFTNWDQTHPGATLSELEGALDGAWAYTRAELITNWAQAQPTARLAEQPTATRPRCVACGTVLVADGRHRRTVRLSGDQPLELERDYARCPQCGSGSFPPG